MNVLRLISFPFKGRVCEILRSFSTKTFSAMKNKMKITPYIINEIRLQANDKENNKAPQYWGTLMLSLSLMETDGFLDR